MKRVLILGAGRSSSSLIRYMLDHAGACQWYLTVADVSLETAQKKIGSNDAGKAVQFDINDPESSKEIIGGADIVISLLPPNFHPLVALRCLEGSKHFITASYVSDELKAFDKEAREKGLVFLNECGLDPGIDHLSAMKVIDDIRDNGGTITSFESFTGGLIAPETDPGNPWRYKFTWNPRNVVMAGQSTAKYLHDGKSKYISYQQLFRRITPIHVPGYGNYEGYANRDSLKYIDTYGLLGISTILRGTLRHKGFCAAWNILVQLGCCDDSYAMEYVSKMTHAGFLNAFLPANPGDNTEEKVCTHFGLKASDPEIKMLKWSGFFEDTPVGLDQGSPAKILEYMLNKKWVLKDEDKDQIVMWHRFRYVLEGKAKEIQASLVATGFDAVYTAMAKTVGLPLGIATRLIASDNIRARGVIIPTTREFYRPILRELGALGIALNELEVP
ncbi:MAG: saccharopine dehydrogenase C-terminal domain-containing protein [Cyclobacteriaceae bacterium]